MPDTIEQWLPVVGWEGLYEVSDQGRVRSVDRVVPFGSQQRTVRSRVLKPGRHIRTGTQYVNLCDGPIHRCHSVHLLVLEAFVGPRPEGLHGCHWNDDHDDNRLANLRWDTPSANGHDAVRNGRNHQTLKDECPQGHAYTAENTKVGKGGGRFCRECHRADGRAKYWLDLENQRRIKREAQQRRRLRLKQEAVA
jgi:hypothetical protein